MEPTSEKYTKKYVIIKFLEIEITDKVIFYAYDNLFMSTSLQ